MPKPKAAEAVAWQNRIVRYADVDPAELTANPLNFRTHPKHQKDALSGVLNQVGLVQNVIVNERSGNVVDGHLRIDLALKEKQATVPVTYVDLSDDEERLVLSSLDSLAALAQADPDRLQELLAYMPNPTSPALAQMLTDLAEANGVILPNTFNALAEWTGMPEFNQQDLMPLHQVIVSFASQADVERFGKTIDQDVTMTTRSIWYPYVARQKRTPFVESEAPDAT